MISRMDGPAIGDVYVSCSQVLEPGVHHMEGGVGVCGWRVRGRGLCWGG